MLPSSEYKLSASAISDLSWLNPTPHAIAVYASRPLSPVTTQHSLPSGRYSLLGPDFHRLDRTSLRLGHSFKYLVGEQLHRVRHFDAKGLRGLHVDDELELARLHDGKIGGPLAFENAADEVFGLTIRGTRIGAIAEESAGLDEMPKFVDRGDRVKFRQGNDLVSSIGEEYISGDDKATDLE